MIYFHNDYNETCHPAILEHMMRNATVSMPGYGTDDACANATHLIRRECKNDALDIHYLVGGTQANLTVIAAALRPHHAVLAADTAHVNVHETGAIEATGHKLILLPGKEGKISPLQVEQAVLSQRNSPDAEHIAKPKMVYISSPTEYGSLYSLAELEELSRICRQYGLYLFVDGARMGYGLQARGNDVTLADFARLCSVFTIGGTKVGAMFGEAVVIAHPEIAEDFRYLIKQRGAMLAKGWLLGQQFEVLFQDGLYYRIAKQANDQADKIRSALQRKGYELFLPGTTNQIFVKLPDTVLERLEKYVTFSVWEKLDPDHTVIRFCTSWATSDNETDYLCEALENI